MAISFSVISFSETSSQHSENGVDQHKTFWCQIVAFVFTDVQPPFGRLLWGRRLLSLLGGLSILALQQPAKVLASESVRQRKAWHCNFFLCRKKRRGFLPFSYQQFVEKFTQQIWMRLVKV